MDENIGEAKQTPSASTEDLLEIERLRNLMLTWRLLGYADGCIICRDRDDGRWIGQNIQYVINDIQCRYEELFGKKMDYRQNKNDHQLMLDCVDIYWRLGGESEFCVKCDTYYVFPDWNCNCESE